MSAELEKVKDHMIDLLVQKFKAKKETGKGLDKKSYSFWSKFSQKLPEDVVKDMEHHPEKETTQNNMRYHLDEQLKKPSIKANVMMFLVNNNVKLF